MTIISNLQDEKEYITLPAPLWEGSEKYGTGVTLKGLYYGKRSKRFFAETYSCWLEQNGDGQCVGTRYREVDENEWLNACDIVGIEPEGVEETEV